MGIYQNLHIGSARIVNAIGKLKILGGGYVKKARWVIQDSKGVIALLGKGSNPRLDANLNSWIITGDKWEVISSRYDLSVNPICIDLKEFDYEICDGILCPVVKPKPHPYRKVIKAWANGAVIQRQRRSTGEWVDCIDNRPAWHSDYKYRVKPKK